MKKRLILPAMAFVFAIGLSFATERSTTNPQLDYVQTPIGVVEVAEISDCGDQMAEICTVKLSPSGEAYPVFDDKELNNQKTGGAVVERYGN